MYYDAINKAVARKNGGLSSAPLLIESFDFAPVAKLQQEGKWEELGDQLIASAKRLEQSGAEGLILCSNTAHRLFDWIDGEVGIPLLHIADITAERMVKDGVKRAGLLGTRFTMGERFYAERFEAQGISVITPDPKMSEEVDRIIFEELARGQVSRVSQRTLKTAITIMGQAKAQAVILGCTELVMLVDPVANVLPVYDTTSLHARAAAEWIMTAQTAAVEAVEVEVA
jgi:aspartate racemase